MILEKKIKMAEYIQKTILISKFEVNPIIDYLQINYGLASAGIFNLKEDGKVEIHPHEGKIEILCNCDEDIIKKFKGMIEQNE